MIDVEDELNHILQDIKITTPQVVEDKQEDHPAPKVNNETLPINSIDTQDEPREVPPVVKANEPLAVKVEHTSKYI